MASMWPKDQAGQLKIASGVIAIIGAVVFFLYVYQPTAEELETKRTRVESLTLVPTGNEVPALLEQVSTAARRAGLDLSTVEPQPVVVGDQFDTYRYKLSVFGNYHQVAEFLTNVGSLTRIVAPVNMSLAVTQDPAATKTRRRADQAVLDTDFEIQTYVAKAGSEENR